MNIVDILITKYAKQWHDGKISFKDENDGNGIVIDKWELEIPKPTHDEIMTYLPEVEIQYKLGLLKQQAASFIQNWLDTTAQSKQYGSSVACASYVTSMNPQWAAEAASFIAWRDAIFIYAINVQNEVQQGGPIPSFEDFVAGLPAMVWPD